VKPWGYFGVALFMFGLWLMYLAFTGSHEALPPNHHSRLRLEARRPGCCGDLRAAQGAAVSFLDFVAAVILLTVTVLSCVYLAVNGGPW
jgi:hypothetical protein